MWLHDPEPAATTFWSSAWNNHENNNQHNHRWLAVSLESEDEEDGFVGYVEDTVDPAPWAMLLTTSLSILSVALIPVCVVIGNRYEQRQERRKRRREQQESTQNDVPEQRQDTPNPFLIDLSMKATGNTEDEEGKKSEVGDERSVEIVFDHQQGHQNRRELFASSSFSSQQGGSQRSLASHYTIPDLLLQPSDQLKTRNVPPPSTSPKAASVAIMENIMSTISSFDSTDHRIHHHPPLNNQTNNNDQDDDHDDGSVEVTTSGIADREPPSSNTSYLPSVLQTPLQRQQHDRSDSISSHGSRQSRSSSSSRRSSRIRQDPSPRRPPSSSQSLSSPKNQDKVFEDEGDNNELENQSHDGSTSSHSIFSFTGLALFDNMFQEYVSTGSDQSSNKKNPKLWHPKARDQRRIQGGAQAIQSWFLGGLLGDTAATTTTSDDPSQKKKDNDEDEEDGILVLENNSPSIVSGGKAPLQRPTAVHDTTSSTSSSGEEKRLVTPKEIVNSKAGGGGGGGHDDSSSSSSSSASLGDDEKQSQIRLVKGWKQYRFYKCDGDMKGIIRLALPFTIHTFVVHVFELMEVAVIGRLVGTDELSALFIVDTVLSLAVMFMEGAVTSLFTLCSHAVGGEQYYLAGQYVQIGVIFYQALLLPLGVVGYFVLEDIVLLFGFKEEVAHIAMQYAQIEFLSYLFNIYREGLDYILEVIEHEIFTAMFTIAQSIVGFVAVFCLAKYGEPTLRDIALLGLALDVFYTIAMVVWILYKGWLKDFWPGMLGNFAPSNIEAVKVFLKTSLPLSFGYMMATGEWEVLTVFAGFLGPAEVSAWGLLGWFWEAIEEITLAVADATEVKVGKMLGSGQPFRARGIANKSLFLGTIISLIFSLPIFALKNVLPGLFTTDETLQRILTQLFPLVGIGNIALMFGSMCWTILGAQGRYALSTGIQFMGSWALTIPLAAIFTLVLRFDLQAMTGAVVVGYACSGALTASVLVRTNWERMSMNVIKDTKRGAGIIEDPTTTDRLASSSAFLQSASADVDYDDYDWDELPEKARSAAMVLGYNQSLWDKEQDPPSSNHYWRRLTPEQQEAAMVLGYNQKKWDEEESSSSSSGS